MPVEIRELIIRATITDPPANTKQEHHIKPEERAEIISACTAQVLKILARKNER